MDEDVLLLSTEEEEGRGCEGSPAGPPGPRWTQAHLGLDHGQTVRAHLRHQGQNVHELVFSDVLHEAVQSDEGSRPPHAGAAHTAGLVVRAAPRRRAAEASRDLQWTTTGSLVLLAC